MVNILKTYLTDDAHSHYKYTSSFDRKPFGRLTFGRLVDQMATLEQCRPNVFRQNVFSAYARQPNVCQCLSVKRQSAICLSAKRRGTTTQR